MIFIEAPAFIRRILELLDDDDYGQFQAVLGENPEAGDVIAGTGGPRNSHCRDGMRETRWSTGHLLPLHIQGQYRVAAGLSEERARRSDGPGRKVLKSSIGNWR
jgi:hypothetical protein